MYRVYDLDERHTEAMRHAYCSMRLDALSEILVNCKDLNGPVDVRGCTLLQLACSRGWVELIEWLLLDPRVNVNQTGHVFTTFTALGYTLHNKDDPTAYLLLKHGATFDITPKHFGDAALETWFYYKDLQACAFNRCKNVCIQLIILGELDPEIRDVMNQLACDVWKTKREPYWIYLEKEERKRGLAF